MHSKYLITVAASLFTHWPVESATAGTESTNILYFLAAERPHPGFQSDSFVIPLTRPADIEHARRFLTDPNLEDRAAPIARVARGRNGINRDHLRSDKREWSWHVTEFIAFTDSAPAKPAMTSPRLVENASDSWYETYGKSGAFFISCKIVQELGPNPLWIISEPQTSDIKLTWANLGEQFSYTVEHSSELIGDWQTVPNVAWPVLDTTITFSMGEGIKFYRLRANTR